MGCCQVNLLESEALITQFSVTSQQSCDDCFREVPLSSDASPLLFKIPQEDNQNRLSYEATGYSSIPITKSSIELAFIRNRIKNKS